MSSFAVSSASLSSSSSSLPPSSLSPSSSSLATRAPTSAWNKTASDPLDGPTTRTCRYMKWTK
eukprot:5196127-Lingulodinium_polyedra.AAC.1